MAETILVIEDERLTRANLISFLASEGFGTLEAPNGRVGIELAQTHMPDLIICDILMPELDGYDVLMTLQQQTQTAAIPFIFLTVSASEDGFRQGLALGADDYLSKPVTSEQLRTAITAQLKKTSLVGGSVAAPLAEPFADAIPDYSGAALSMMTSTVTYVDSVEAAKAQLLEQLCPLLKQRLTSLRETVEKLQAQTTDKTSSYQLRDEFVRLLSLVNETMALQKSLTPTNATDLLGLFSSMVQEIEEE